MRPLLCIIKSNQMFGVRILESCKAIDDKIEIFHEQELQSWFYLHRRLIEFNTAKFVYPNQRN